MKNKNQIKMKSDITVILPIHEINEINEKYFTNAINSINAQIVKPDEVLIIAKSDETLLKFLSDFNYGEIGNNVRIIENTGNSDVCSQINLGVSQVKTEWFSFLEFDDEYSRIWFKNVVEYRNHYNFDVYMPIIVDVNKEGKFMGFMNEAVWAHEFCDEMGVLDNDALLRYQNFNIDGIVMRKSTFEENGGMKTNIKLYFIYEFLLRLTQKSVPIMVIPKLGYKHVNQRNNSLFDMYVKEMDAKESQFWLETAKHEYFYNYEREITYQK